MVRIKLKNGSTLEVKAMIFQGKIIDSNGTETGGNTNYVFVESEVNALNNAVPLQAAYDAIYPPTPEVVEEVESSE